jgi:hypothetical protein
MKGLSDLICHSVKPFSDDSRWYKTSGSPDWDEEEPIYGAADYRDIEAARGGVEDGGS